MSATSIDPEKTHRFIVQTFNEKVEKWQNINDRIFVREFMKTGVSKAEAVRRAGVEADKQVAGWQAGYPLRHYRAVASESMY